MSTKNPRYNVTLDPKTAHLLTTLAKQENQSIASLAKELILEALERREDLALSAIAEIRDIKTAKYIDHEDAWK